MAVSMDDDEILSTTSSWPVSISAFSYSLVAIDDDMMAVLL